MPNDIWEISNRLLAFVIPLFPIIFVLLILFFIGTVISIFKFNKKHNAKLQKLNESHQETKKYIEEQRKKHFPHLSHTMLQQKLQAL